MNNSQKKKFSKQGFLSFYGKFFLLLSVMVWGCEPNSFVISTPNDNLNQSMVREETKEGELPITAKTVINGEEIDLEVAITPEQQGLGLMYRDFLAPNRGMLFPFEFPRRASFWMKNVDIPLDMIFLYQGEVIFIEANVPPCNAEPCPIYGPDQIVDQVLELAGGRAEELNISTGDRIEIQFLNPEGE